MNRTGASAGMLAVAGVLLVVLGGAALLLSRRRRGIQIPSS